MADRLRAFRMTASTLYLTNAKGELVRAVGPGDAVEKTEELELLGAERIEALIAEGEASPIGEKFEPKTAPLTAKEKADAQKVVADSLKSSKSSESLEQAAAERAKNAGTAKAPAQMPTPPVAGPSRS